MSEGEGLDALGLHPGEVVGQSIFELFSDSRGTVDAHRRALGGEQVRYEVEVNGIRFECALSPLFNEDGDVRGTVGVAADTMDYRRALEDLRRSEDSLARAQKIAHLGNWDWDIVGNELRWSDEIYRIFGLTPQEFDATYEAFLDAVHPDDRDHVTESVDQALTGKKPYVIDHRIIRRDGEERVVHERAEVTFDEESQPVRMIGTVQDVTEAKWAREQLRLSERKFETLFESAPNSVVVADIDGRIVLVNGRTELLFGYSREELLGEPVEILIPGALKQKHQKCRSAYHARPVQRQMAVRDVLHGLRKDGTEVPVEITLSPMELREGLFVMAIVADRTERQKLEERLLQSQKMEAIGQLAAGIAHDFNNLLTTVLTCGGLLLENLAPDDPDREEAVEIIAAAKRAAELTKQLLALGRKQVLQPKVLNLNDVVGGMKGMLRRLIREDIRSSMSLDPALDLTEMDPTQLEQVIVNLAVNAQDAMPRGGSMTIETANVVLDEAYASQRIGASAGPHVMLAVSDTGVGMDDTTRQKIFDPFFTTKARGEGTGLGLATVYGIVKQSGGNIWVYSEPRKGTTFKIYLPRAPEGAHQVTEAAVEVSSHAPGTETVLLVEDEAGVRRAATRALGRLGYTVLDAGTPSEGLSICETHRGRVHLLLTDVVLPEMSGTELAARASRIRPDIKVLYISGYAQDAIVRHGVLIKGLSFLPKPFTPETLATKVREVLDAPGPPAVG